jgi:hypothetical protein
VGAIVPCASNCTGIDIILYLLPGDLRRDSEPRRLFALFESLRSSGERSLRTLDRELAMESGCAVLEFLSRCGCNVV